MVVSGADLEFQTGNRTADVDCQRPVSRFTQETPGLGPDRTDNDPRCSAASFLLTSDQRRIDGPVRTRRQLIYEWIIDALGFCPVFHRLPSISQQPAHSLALARIVFRYSSASST
jgi:hypothetical protein